MSDEEPSELMRRYAAGDETAFEPLYRSMGPPLARFCMRLAGLRTDGCDVFQETFMRIHRARSTFVERSNPLHWAYAIARSVYIDRLRYRRRRPEQLGPAKDASEIDRRMGRDDPEATLDARDAHTVVLEELARMSETNRVAYILIREEELSVKDAAAILGLTEDAVKKRAHRAYAQLRAALGAAGWRPEGRGESWDVVPAEA